MDFLIPDVLPGRSPAEGILLRRPMPYASALNGLRAALRNLTGGSASSAVPLWRTYSLHGAKATMLSWARQLAAPEDMRREQGHHKVDGGKSSVRLYSRDDVWGPLRLQVGVVQALHSGWRPLSPQARGALPPIPEAPVDLPPHQIMYVLPPLALVRPVIVARSSFFGRCKPLTPRGGEQCRTTRTNGGRCAWCGPAARAFGFQ